MTGLRRRGTGCSMAQYDRLPAPARAWIAAAVLPWSAASVARLWRRLARDCAGDVAQITARLDLAERRTLAREAARVRRKGSGLSANWAVPRPATTPARPGAAGVTPRLTAARGGR